MIEILLLPTLQTSFSIFTIKSKWNYESTTQEPILPLNSQLFFNHICSRKSNLKFSHILLSKIQTNVEKNAIVIGDSCILENNAHY